MTDQKRAFKSWLRQVEHFWRQKRDARRCRIRRARQEGFLVVLGIMKNEAMILQEWIDHYLWQGADKIVLIDNGSSDDSIAIAKANHRGGKVECISRPQKYNQKGHYHHAIRTLDLCNKYEWLLIADLDEFWFCKDGSLVSEALRQDIYAEVDVIYVNWTMFGSSGFAQQPKSVRESFVMRKTDLHEEEKWACRLSRLTRVKKVDIHYIFGELARRINGNNTFQLNHYVIQSREYFEKVKMVRGSAVFSTRDFMRDWAYFADKDANCSVEDRTLANLLSQASSVKEPPPPRS